MGTKLALDLKVARRRSGLSQQDVAILLSVDRTLISKFERGHRMPSGEQVAVLSLVYGLPAPELYRAALPELRSQLKERVAALCVTLVGSTGPPPALAALRSQLTTSPPPDHEV